MAERHLPLEGAHNWRDLGGYETGDGRRLRWGRVYRAGELGDLSPRDVDALVRRGLSAVMDLRSAWEHRNRGFGPLEQAGVEHFHLPLDLAAVPAVASNPAVSLDYAAFLEGREDSVVCGLAWIASQSGPVVFHCTAGKDRTGMLAALLLGLLGVPRPLVVQDYVLTRRYSPWVDLPQEVLDRWNHKVAASGTGVRLTRPMLDASPKMIEHFLDRVQERYGGPLGVLEAGGGSAELADSLRSRLLEAP